MAELITNDSIVYVASKNDHANNNTNSNKNDPNATTVGDDNNDSDSEDEYLLLDIYDEEILKYSNPLDGLAIINFESKNPTIIINSQKYTAQRVPVPVVAPSHTSPHKTEPTPPTTTLLYNVDNNCQSNITGIGQVHHHFVIANNDNNDDNPTQNPNTNNTIHQNDTIHQKNTNKRIQNATVKNTKSTAPIRAPTSNNVSKKPASKQVINKGTTRAKTQDVKAKDNNG